MKKKNAIHMMTATIAVAVMLLLSGCGGGGGKSLNGVVTPTDNAAGVVTPFENETPDDLTEKDAAEIGTFDADPQTAFSGGTTIAGSGASFLDMSTCAASSCHTDNADADLNKYEPFLKTNHNLAWSKKSATFTTSAAAGRKYCVQCHTVTGPFYDADEDHVFDTGTDYAPFGLSSLYDTTGKFGLTIGNFLPFADINDANLTAELKGIQCENCHGPASLHNGNKNNIVTGYQAYGAKTCDYCHDQNAEWKKSGHATSRSLISGTSASYGACMPCHSAEGFVEYAAYTKTSTKDDIVYFIDQGFRTVANGFGEGQGAHNINCAACHDPHDKYNEFQLRLPPEELCITCHNGRKKLPGDSHAPHGNLQGRVLNGQGPVNTNGEMLWDVGGKYLCGNNEESTVAACGTGNYYPTVLTSIGPTMGSTTCVDCHMYMSGKTDYGHTFKPRTEACLNCHASMDAANVIGQIQADFQVQWAALDARLDQATAASGTFSTADLRLYKNALWNLDYLNNDGSKGFHNKDLADATFVYTDAILKSIGY